MFISLSWLMDAFFKKHCGHTGKQGVVSRPEDRIGITFCNNRATTAIDAYVCDRKRDAALIARHDGNGFCIFLPRMWMNLKQPCCGGSSRHGVSSAAEARLGEHAESELRNAYRTWSRNQGIRRKRYNCLEKTLAGNVSFMRGRLHRAAHAADSSLRMQRRGFSIVSPSDASPALLILTLYTEQFLRFAPPAERVVPSFACAFFETIQFTVPIEKNSAGGIDESTRILHNHRKNNSF